MPFSHPVLFPIFVLSGVLSLYEPALTVEVDYRPRSICHVHIFSEDIAYFSELDPLWQDEGLYYLFHPESLEYQGKSCLEACAHPKEYAAYCSGCEGELFPLIGKAGRSLGKKRLCNLLLHRGLKRFLAEESLDFHAIAETEIDPKETRQKIKYNVFIKNNY